MPRIEVTGCLRPANWRADRQRREGALVAPKAETRAAGACRVHAHAAVLEVALELGLGLEGARHASERNQVHVFAREPAAAQRTASGFHRTGDVLAEPEQMLHDLLERRARAHRPRGQVATGELAAARPVEHARATLQEQRSPLLVVVALGR